MKKPICIILASCLLLALSSCNNVIDDREVTTTESVRETYIDDNGWAVPVYENINPAGFDKEKFYKDETGRIHYEDDKIKSRTGIDLSAFQGEIDWKKVASDGIDFAMLRIGCRGWGPSGLIYEDDRFEEYYESANENGIDIGVYFYSQAISEAEALEEAEFVYDKIKNKDIKYPIAFDWERPDDSASETKARTTLTTPDQVSDNAEIFCNYFSAKGYNSLVYFNCSDGYNLFNLQQLSDNHFWIAEYGNYPNFYYDYQIWQYTCSGKVDGIDASVDLNICLYSY